MPKVKFGTFLAVSIPAGLRTSPQVVIPAGTNEVDVVISRDAWPAAGCDLELQFSYDGGSTWSTKIGPLHIDPFVATAKQPTPTPCSIGYGWGDSQAQPTHARGRINTPATFLADITLSSL